MLNRLTVSALIKTVILATSFCVVVGFSLNAWDSWSRLQVASRISVIADASANLFKAMHNLRTDRSTTTRMLNSDDADGCRRSRNICAASAMRKCLRWAMRSVTLGTLEFAQQKTLVPELDRLFKTLGGAAEGILGDDGQAEGAAPRRRCPRNTPRRRNALLDISTSCPAALAANVNHQDATIDQLLAIKQIAWLLRNTAGEASLIVSTGLAAGKISPEAKLAYTKFAGGTEIAWNALELAAAGMQLPPALAQRDGRDQDRLFRAAISRAARPAAQRADRRARSPRSPPTSGARSPSAGSRPPSTSPKPRSTPPRITRTAQYASARNSLIVQLALLLGALALTAGAMTLVTRRVIKPLHTMRDAMLKVAAGDLAVDTGYTSRSDEIGALAGALDTFKQQAADKARIEAQERERNAGAATRQQAIENYVGEFETRCGRR